MQPVRPKSGFVAKPRDRIINKQCSSNPHLSALQTSAKCSPIKINAALYELKQNVVFYIEIINRNKSIGKFIRAHSFSKILFIIN